MVSIVSPDCLMFQISQSGLFYVPNKPDGRVGSRLACCLRVTIDKRRVEVAVDDPVACPSSSLSLSSLQSSDTNVCESKIRDTHCMSAATRGGNTLNGFKGFRAEIGSERAIIWP